MPAAFFYTRARKGKNGRQDACLTTITCNGRQDACLTTITCNGRQDACLTTITCKKLRLRLGASAFGFLFFGDADGREAQREAVDFRVAHLSVHRDVLIGLVGEFLFALGGHHRPEGAAIGHGLGVGCAADGLESGFEARGGLEAFLKAAQERAGFGGIKILRVAAGMMGRDVNRCAEALVVGRGGLGRAVFRRP